MDAEMRSPRDTPNIIVAPSEISRIISTFLFVSPGIIRQLLDDSQNAKLGEFAGLVHGNSLVSLPDGQAIEQGSGGLMKATALFRGLKRPRISPGRDKEIYVYVTTPDFSYIYPLEGQYNAGGPTRVEKPLNSVFTTFIEFGKEAIDEAKSDFEIPAEYEVKGVVHFWEWTISSPDNPNLPEKSKTRYTERVW